jgi:hypothetical protein
MSPPGDRGEYARQRLSHKSKSHPFFGPKTTFHTMEICFERKFYPFPKGCPYFSFPSRHPKDAQE